MQYDRQITAVTLNKREDSSVIIVSALPTALHINLSSVSGESNKFSSSLQHIQTGYVADPTFFSLCYVDSFFAIKQPNTETNQYPPSNAEVNESVELCLHYFVCLHVNLLEKAWGQFSFIPFLFLFIRSKYFYVRQLLPRMSR
jgi:hypothetical protein